MSLIITYPWARPHGYNLKLKKKKRKKPQAASSKRQAASLTNINNRIIRDV